MQLRGGRCTWSTRSRATQPLLLKSLAESASWLSFAPRWRVPAPAMAVSSVLEGEAGIGKTRLVVEALGHALQLGFGIACASTDELERRRPFGVVSDALQGANSGNQRRNVISDLLRGEA